MDSLYSGLKALEGQTNGKLGNRKYLDSEELRVPIVGVEKDMFVLVDDVLPLLERAAIEPLPPKDEKGPQNRTKFERSFQFLNFAMEGATKWDPVGWKASDELKQIFGQPKHINQQESAAPVIYALEPDLEQARARINELETKRRSSKKKTRAFLEKGCIEWPRNAQKSSLKAKFYMPRETAQQIDQQDSNPGLDICDQSGAVNLNLRTINV